MFNKAKWKKMCRQLVTGSALCIAGFSMFACSDTYDLDSEQPSGLNTIFGYLQQQGNFTNTVKLIQDLGYDEVLAEAQAKNRK